MNGWATCGRLDAEVRQGCFLLITVFVALTACAPSPPMPTRAVVATVPITPVSKPTLFPTIPPTFTATAVPTNPPTAASRPSSTPCAEPGHIETGIFPSQTAGPSAYRIFLPPCYGSDGRFYPTLYMLPGNNQTDAIGDELSLDETAETAIQSGQMPPFLIVMPAGGQIALESSGGSGSYETVILDGLIPAIEAAYCAWPDAAGRAIGGLPRGGYWALEIAFRHPAEFVSVGGHSAALLDIAAGVDINPQYTAFANDLGDLRIYLDIGENDGGIANTRKLHEDMASQSLPHTWVLNEGGHDNVYWAAHLMEYLTWYSVPWSLNRNQYPTCSQK